MANYFIQELPEELSEGQKIIFPKMQTYSMHDYETVLEHMRVYSANISEGVMRAVFDALVSTMVSWMPLGHTIKIDGLGVFSLSLGFDDGIPSETPKEKYRHICIKGINFKPDPKLLKELNKEATFDRVETKATPKQKPAHTLEERIAIARQLIGKNGFMTLPDYVRATGLSRSTASRDLKNIVANPESHITIRGTHSHKVWVLSDE